MFAHVKFESALVGLVCIAVGCMNGKRILRRCPVILPQVSQKERCNPNETTLTNARPMGAIGPRAQQAGKLETRLLLSRSEGGTVARAGGNTCAPPSAHVGSLG